MLKAQAKAAKHQQALDRKSAIDQAKSESEQRMKALAAEASKARSEEQARLWNKAHFTKAKPGQKCPKGWQAVMTKENCALAHKVVGGVNDVERLQLSWNDRPNGCFLHLINNHLNFNQGLFGELNEQDEQICERDTWAADTEVATLEAEVKTAEKERSERVSKLIADEAATRQAEARAQLERRRKATEAAKYREDHAWWKLNHTQLEEQNE